MRLLPVKDEFVGDCQAIAEKLPGRVDVDDRDMTVGKKIRDAEREWIPFIIVYGDKEKASGEFQARIRGESELAFSVDALAAAIGEKQGGMPFEPLPLPVMLSKRIIFRG